jgi:hypothetical protein
MKNSDAIKNLMQLAVFSQSQGIIDLDIAFVTKQSIDSLRELVKKLEKEEAIETTKEQPKEKKATK